MRLSKVRIATLGVVVVLGLVASGCSSGKSDGGGTTTTSSTTTKAVRGAELSAGELTSALADVGVGTYASPTAKEPVEPVTGAGPLRYLADQVAVLALETRDHTGTTGAQLDALVDGDLGGAPFSLVVAAYVKAGDTPGAKLSRRLMGAQPWAQSAALVFPDVVLGLFANDVAKEATGPAGARQAPARGTALVEAGSSALAPRAPALAGEATGVCSTLSGWVDSVIQTMVDALKVDTSGGGLTGLLGEIWNTVVDLAVEAGKQVVATLTAPILAIIKTGLAIAGTLSMMAALLRPWSVSGEQQPSPVDYGVEPGSGNPAKIVATVDTAGSEPFTAGVVDCAQQAGVDLPDPTTAKGSKISWKPIGIEEVGTGIETDDVVGADGTASLRFTTKTESKEAATEGTPVPHTTAVTIEVERTQVKDMQALLQTLLTGSIPGVVGQIASAVFGVVTQPIFDELATMLGTSSAASGTVISHTEPEEKPKGTTTTKVDECAGLATGTIPDGTWKGGIELDVDGNPTQASGAITSTGGGDMTITVEGGKVTSGTWTFDFSSSGTIEVQGGSGTIDSMAGKGGGSVAGTAAKPILSGTGTISGQISVTVSGFSTEVPIDETHPASTSLTVEEASCDQVTGTFVPSFTEATGGMAVFSGVARWTGTPA